MTATWSDFVKFVPDRVLLWTILRLKWRDIMLRAAFPVVVSSTMCFLSFTISLNWEEIAGIVAGITAIWSIHLKIMKSMINSALNNWGKELWKELNGSYVRKDLCTVLHGECKDHITNRLDSIDRRHEHDDSHPAARKGT